MTQSNRREPRFIIDDRGREIVLVPLRGSARPAVVDARDFRRIMKAGYSDQWQATPNTAGQVYVTVATPDRRMVTVARLVMKAGYKERVTVVGPDRLDLRRRNLAVRRYNRGPQKPRRKGR
jgi:hypothetical protein